MKKRLAPPIEDLEEDLVQARPFFYILELVLVFLFVTALVQNPNLRSPGLLVPFGIAMIVHGALHWFSPFLTRYGIRHVAVYLIVQILLIVLLTGMSKNIGLLIGLWMALTGETVGILEDWRHAIVTVLAMTTMLSLNYLWISDGNNLPTWVASSALTMVFVAVYVLLYLRQAQARKQAQHLLKELEEAYQKASNYAQQVETLTLEAERQRMARELHDTLAQGLTGIILQLEAIEARLEQKRYAEVEQITSQAQMRARQVLGEARQVIDDLRIESDISLEAAINQTIDRFSRSMGIPCELKFPDGLMVHSELRDQVVRCVSEGLTNIARHARATLAKLSMSVEDQILKVIIRDNGQGFDPEKVESGHYGLLGLKERTRLLGGTLEVISQSGKGTSLTMIVPLEQE